MRRSIPLAGGEVSQLALDGEADAPRLHFAHANGFNAQTYRGLLAPLAGRVRDRGERCARPRLHDAARALPAAPGMAEGWTVFRDDLRAVIERIAPDGAILAGHSMGATASLMVAAAWPKLVRALVLIEPVLMPKGMTAGASDLAAKADKRRDTFPSADAAFEAYRGRGAFRSWPDETLRDYLKGGLEAFEGGMRLACRPAWEAQAFRSTPPGVSALAAALECPVTLIHAADGTASAAEIAIFKSLCPAARVLLQPGATHFLPMEFPEAVRDEIVRIRWLAP